MGDPGLKPCGGGRCIPQPGTQLIGDLDAEYTGYNGFRPSVPESVLRPCLKWRLPRGEFPSGKNGDQELLDSLHADRPEISYTLHTHAEYRPCDVKPGDRRACDLIHDGMLVDTAEDCAALCTCLRDLPGVYCNTVAWVWRDYRAQNANCFPKYIEVRRSDVVLQSIALFAPQLQWTQAFRDTLSALPCARAPSVLRCKHLQGVGRCTQAHAPFTPNRHAQAMLSNCMDTCSTTRASMRSCGIHRLRCWHVLFVDIRLLLQDLPNDGKLPDGSCELRGEDESYSLLLLRNDTQGPRSICFNCDMCGSV